MFNAFGVGQIAIISMSRVLGRKASTGSRGSQFTTRFSKRRVESIGQVDVLRLNTQEEGKKDTGSAIYLFIYLFIYFSLLLLLLLLLLLFENSVLC